MQLVAHLIHVLLYAIILLMPVTGFIAWHRQVGLISEPHALGKNAIMLIVGGHVVGAQSALRRQAGRSCPAAPALVGAFPRNPARTQPNESKFSWAVAVSQVRRRS